MARRLDRRVDGDRWGAGVGEDATDDLRLFDAGDDLHRAAAVFAGLELDAEDAFEPLRSSHREALWHRIALPLGCRSVAATLANSGLPK
jgi:hypothetical protein